MTDLIGHPAITYGNFSFGTGPRVNSAVEIYPQYDRAERTVTGIKYTIHVRAIITSDDGVQMAGPSSESDTADTVIAKLERELMIPGKILVYTGWGHGTFSINTSGTTRDIAFGPKPRYAKITPIGSTRVMEVDWIVEVVIGKNCDSSNALYGRVGDLREVNYSETFNIDEHGLTTRTIAGHLTITLNRANATTNTQAVLRNADMFRDSFQVNIPQGFRRVQNQWILSEDKATVHFIISDKEQESPTGFPPGCTDIQFDHAASFEYKGKKSLPYTGSISGYIKVVKTIPIDTAWTRVLLMLRTKLTEMQERGNTVIIVGFKVTVHLYQHRISFVLSYILGTSAFALQNFTQDNALFTGSPTTSTREWQASMAGSAYAQRGLAKLAATTDTIIDPCHQRDTIVTDRIAYGLPSNVFGASLTNQRPRPERSYLYFDNFLEVVSNPGQDQHKVMATRPNFSLSRSTIETVMNLGGGVGGFGAAAAGAGGMGSQSNIISQIHGTCDVVVKLKGKGVRLAYEVELPSLISLWDRNAEMVPSVCRMQAGIASEIGGVLVYVRRWILVYRISFNNPAELRSAIQSGFGSAVLSVPSDARGFHTIHNLNVQR